MKRFCFFLCLWFAVVAVPAYATLPQGDMLSSLKARAERGDAEAQNHLGVHYADLENYEYASVWFRRAAQQGDAFGQYGLATLYREGLGLPRDYAKAATWYAKAARQGDAKAQYHLGTMYYNGAGVKKNVNQAINLFLKSAEAGEQRAHDYLKLISARNQHAVNALKAAPSKSGVVMADIANMGQAEADDIATNSLGLVYLQGLGASVTLEALFLWVVLPILAVLGLLAI